MSGARHWLYDGANHGPVRPGVLWKWSIGTAAVTHGPAWYSNRACRQAYSANGPTTAYPPAIVAAMDKWPDLDSSLFEELEQAIEKGKLAVRDAGVFDGDKA